MNGDATYFIGTYARKMKVSQINRVQNFKCVKGIELADKISTAR